MSRAAEVMVQHVENLKRHHLREHTELEEMKRLIQQNSRNRQVAENRDDDEQRLKLPLLRTFQQVTPAPVPWQGWWCAEARLTGGSLATVQTQQRSPLQLRRSGNGCGR
nr:lymphoid-restricted membrane protein-like [Pelodiscus sinensis]|eukprot:XP_025036848.1 lymphoid-restricted membrane protein-like [Pelodiscus sinensis]